MPYYPSTDPREPGMLYYPDETGGTGDSGSGGTSGGSGASGGTARTGAPAPTVPTPPRTSDRDREQAPTKDELPLVQIEGSTLDRRRRSFTAVSMARQQAKAAAPRRSSGLKL